MTIKNVPSTHIDAFGGTIQSAEKPYDEFIRDKKAAAAAADQNSEDSDAGTNAESH